MAARDGKTYVWRPPRGLATIVTVVMGINVALRLASAGVWAAFGDGAIYLGATRFTDPQRLRSALDLAQGLVFLASASSLAWIYRACENAHTFRRNLTNSPWGSILWRLVPVASRHKPLQAMSETWSASAAGFKKVEDRILIVGWTAFIASSVVNVFLLVAARSLGAPTVGIVEGLAGVVVSLLFVIIVRRIPAM